MSAKQRICPYCEKVFTQRHPLQVYCSTECRRAFDNANTAFQRNLDVHVNAQLRPCATCGTLITDYRCQECWARIRGSGRLEMPEDVTVYSVGVSV